MICYSCGKNKNELGPFQSEILKGTTLYMCQTCVDSRFEPRWVIILGGRQKGPEHVKDYITKRRYVGKTITAEELIA